MAWNQIGRRAILGLAVCLGIAGCAPAGASTNPSPDASAVSPPASKQAPPPEPATLTVTPPGGLEAAELDGPVVFSLRGGTLESVEVRQGDQVVAGTIRGGEWTPTDPLAFDAEYVLVAMTGAGEQLTQPFHTMKLGKKNPFYMPFSDDGVGVGAPVYIRFEYEVDKSRRADIQERATVTTVPEQPGSWGWISETELAWRPKEHWQPGTKVSVSMRWAGVATSDQRRLAKSYSTEYTISDVARILRVDISGHEMTVLENGKVVKTVPVTAGKPKFATRSGEKIVLEKHKTRRMTSESAGITSESYDVTVKWAMRVTWTGEFLHAAPWSVGSQGHSNVSHGCVGMSTSNAEWVFNRADVGDVVSFTGSNKQMIPYEGVGVWQYSWEDWQAQSAL